MSRPNVCLAIALSLLISSCQVAFGVDVSASDAGIVVSFYDSAKAPKKAVTKCIWRVDVVDERVQRPVFTLRSEPNCLPLSTINLSSPPKDFLVDGDLRQLKGGRIYTVQVIADDSQGQSRPWTI